MHAFGPDPTIEGYALRREPFMRKTYSRTACTWYSMRPGWVKRIASVWASALISQARRSRASSSGSVRSRSSLRIEDGDGVGLVEPGEEEEVGGLAEIVVGIGVPHDLLGSRDDREPLADGVHEAQPAFGEWLVHT